MATAEFSKFADIVSAALSHLLQFEIAQLEFCPLAFFIVMLPKAQLTSYSKMSDFRLMVIPLWLSRSLGPFLYSSGYSCHLFFFLFIWLHQFLVVTCGIFVGWAGSVVGAWGA